MTRGSHTSRRGLILCGLLALSLSADLWGYGAYVRRITSPVTPFGMTFVPFQQFLIVCQSLDGQAARYKLSSASEAGQLEPLYSPVTEGTAMGIAWCDNLAAGDRALYWLVQTTSEAGNAYSLMRTNVDGFILSASLTLKGILPTATLGNLAYVPENDAFWTVDYTTDTYLCFDRATGNLVTNAGFPCPVRHPDAGVAYGLGLSYVSDGQLDLLVGYLTDLRAMRVVRVDLQGNPVGVSYDLDVSTDENRAGWTTGIAYCQANGGHFTAVGDTLRDRILVFDTPAVSIPGVSNVVASVTQTGIGPGETAESMVVDLTWKNNYRAGSPYSSIVIQYRDNLTGTFLTAGTIGGEETSFSHAINREGIFTYRLTPYFAAKDLPQATIDVRVGPGAVLAKTATAGTGKTSAPFAIDIVKEDPLTVYVPELRPREGETTTQVHRFEKGGGGAFVSLSPITSPVPASNLTIGLAWDSDTNDLVWLGQTSAGDYQIYRSALDGTSVTGPLSLSGNPYPRDNLGDIAYDPQSKTVWVVAQEHQTIFSFDPGTGAATAERVTLPTTLPGEQGTWGLASGISVVPATPNGGFMFVTGLGKVPSDPDVPALGAGVVSRLVAFVRNGGQGSIVVNNPIDLTLSTGSSLVRGIAVAMNDEPSAFVVAGDIGWLYEVRFLGFGPRFLRGDANGDGASDVADAIFALTYLFKGGTEPGCLDAADANDSGAVNLSDALYILRSQFDLLSETFRASPFWWCGNDPAADSLSCLTYSHCP
jgi:hypothetical protein